VVVEAVEDLDTTAISELPVRAVGLPEFVGEVGLEADERRLRPFARLRGDQPMASEDAPDRRHRGRGAEFEAEVVGDGVRAAVVAGGSEVMAEVDDRCLDLGCGCAGARSRSS
jgi:hypothetical protein